MKSNDNALFFKISNDKTSKRKWINGKRITVKNYFLKRVTYLTYIHWLYTLIY